MRKNYFLSHWKSIMLMISLQLVLMGTTFASQDDPIFGCTNPDACNYDEFATDDDGSCTLALPYYPDTDGDGFGNLFLEEYYCIQPLGYVDNSGDCDDSNSDIYLGAAEICNDLDDDCDGEMDNGVTIAFYADADGDGFGWADQVQMACELPTGFVTNDTDCDDNAITFADVDADGFGSGPALDCGDVIIDGDCDDNDPSVGQMAAETCNGLDEDCDGEADNGVTNNYYIDADGDGFGSDNEIIVGCELPLGYVTNFDDCDDAVFMYADMDGDGFGSGIPLDCGDVMLDGDCDDSNNGISPAAIEICGNDTDEDCDGLDEICPNPGCTDVSACNYNETATESDGSCFFPEAYFLDCDGNCLTDTDGDGVCDEIEVGGCTDPSACNFNEFATDPGACQYAQAEVCNGQDDDCDGEVDNGVLLPFYIDMDGDGFGSADSIMYACSAIIGFVDNLEDCDDANITYEDTDGDGYGAGNPMACASALNNTDCEDNDANINPGAAEICNENDENCNGEVDEFVTYTFYQDSDADGFGNPAESIQLCELTTGYVANADDCDDDFVGYDDNDGDGYGIGDVSSCGTAVETDDCDDSNAAIFPSAVELCNNIDDDCDLEVDEFVTLTFYADVDGDGYGDVDSTMEACESPVGFVSNFEDCNDDALTFEDLDGDGYGSGDWSACGTAVNNTDCNDNDNTIYPEANEMCNLIDDDCDEEIDEFVTTTYYLDTDGDGFGTDFTTTEACELPLGYVSNFDDCDDNALAYEDMDGDGYGAGIATACGSSIWSTDCNDADVSISPISPEVCGDGVDNDCQGGDITCIILGCTDPTAFNYNPTANTEDGTCVPVVEGCTDITAFNFDPAANTENGTCIPVVEGCTDALALNYNPAANTNDGSCIPVISGCMDATACNYNPDANTEDGSCYEPIAVYYNCDTTCINDADADGVCDEIEIVGCMDPLACNYNMNATDAATCTYASNEICNDLDDDCDGEVDEGVLIAYYADADADGFGDPQNDQFGCSPISGYVSNADDCDDALITYQDNDNDGFGGLGFDACGVLTNDDCNENDNTINPGVTEVCGNTVDENCNGLVDENCAVDMDGDGYSNIDDCDDNNAAIYPDQVEVCNGIDDNCNNLVDDNLVFVIYYVDQDIDGYGTAESDTLCQAPTVGFATETGDCDDSDANINPGETEAFNGIDDNCDGVIDEDMLDTDGDGVENGLDADDDNDGLLDEVEDDFNGDGLGGDDCDNDGIPNTMDTDECSIFIPEGFSPNKDGVNDVFEIQQLPYGAVVELEVYNRWGALVFESTDYKNTWSGVNNDDEALPSGVYYYVVRIANKGFEQTNPLTIWR